MTKRKQAMRQVAQHPSDTIHFRMQQAHGAAAALMWLYMGQADDDMMHYLSPQQMMKALWGLCELTRQGCDASEAIP